MFKVLNNINPIVLIGLSGDKQKFPQTAIIQY